MKKVLPVLVCTFLLAASAMADGIELNYTNHTAYSSGNSTNKTINVMASIGDSITFTINNLSTMLGAWKFNRDPVTGANVNPYSFIVTAAGAYSVNTNSAMGTVYFYICVQNGSRPLAPAPIIGSSTNCADAVYPATSYHLDGISVLPYCVTSYTWIAPNGASVVTSNNGLEATVTFTSAFVAGNLSVRANTTAGTSKERMLFISCPNFNSRRLTAEEAEETAMVNVFPNPFTDKLNVTTNSDETFTLSISDMTGKVIAKIPITGSGSLDAMPLPKGIYFYTLSNDGGTVKRGRIMKQ